MDIFVYCDKETRGIINIQRTKKKNPGDQIEIILPSTDPRLKDVNIVFHFQANPAGDDLEPTGKLAPSEKITKYKKSYGEELASVGYTGPDDIVDMIAFANTHYATLTTADQKADFNFILTKAIGFATAAQLYGRSKASGKDNSILPG